MKWNNDEGVFELLGGRTLPANCGILGISEHQDVVGGVEAFEGYDGELFVGDLTQADRNEIAEYAIALWRRWSKP